MASMAAVMVAGLGSEDEVVVAESRDWSRWVVSRCWRSVSSCWELAVWSQGIVVVVERSSFRVVKGRL